MEEVRVPGFISDAGIQEYTNSVITGLHATLKSRPEDFVVTEINSNGKLVVLDNHNLPSSPASLPLPPPPPPSMSATKKKRKRGGHGSYRPDPTLVPPLKDLVSLEQYKSIHHLADEYKATLACDHDHVVTLGHKGGKEERSLIHCALRFACPALSTNTSRNKQNEVEMFVVPDPKYRRLVEVLSPEESERVLMFLNTFNAVSSAKDHIVLRSGYSRPQRTKIHHLLSEEFGHIISTHTATEKEEVVMATTQEEPETIKIPRLEQTSASSATPTSSTPPTSSSPPTSSASPTPSTSNIIIRIRRRHENKTPAREGMARRQAEGIITKFVLWKRNQETFHVLHQLAQLLNCGSSQFSMCGTKDKIAITSQELAVKGVTPQRLLKAREQLNPNHFDVGNFEYVKESLQLGGHSGNHFKIILRDVRPQHRGSGAERDLEGVVTSALERGGGAGDTPGPGRDLEGVVTSALESVRDCGFINYFGLQRFNRSMTMPHVGLALLHNDLRTAVNTALLESERISADMKEHIKKGEFEVALKSLSPDMPRERLMLQKLKQYGGTRYGYLRALMSIPYHQRLLYVHSLSSVLWNHAASYRIKEYGLKPVEGDLVLRATPDSQEEMSVREQVHTMTAYDVTSQLYSLQDVVLPVVGTSIIYPSNRVRDRFCQLLDSTGVSLTSFRVPQLGIHAPGTYRKLVAYPKQLSWELTSSPPSEVTQESHDQGVHLTLNFNLNTSTYATMCIRELTKTLH